VGSEMCIRDRAGGGESIFSELVFAKNGIENRDGGFESHHIAISTFINHH
jgi:hypothetical protein